MVKAIRQFHRKSCSVCRLLSSEPGNDFPPEPATCNGAKNCGQLVNDYLRQPLLPFPIPQAGAKTFSRDFAVSKTRFHIKGTNGRWHVSRRPREDWSRKYKWTAGIREGTLCIVGVLGSQGDGPGPNQVFKRSVLFASKMMQFWHLRRLFLWAVSRFRGGLHHLD